MAVPALGALALGAGAIVASVGSLVLPFYAGYKLHKRLERRRSAKRRRRAREAMWRKLEDMRWRGCYSILLTGVFVVISSALLSLNSTELVRYKDASDLHMSGWCGMSLTCPQKVIMN